MDLVEFARALFRHKFSIIGLTLLSTAASVGLLFLVTPEYKSTASLYLSVQNATTAGDLNQGATYAENQVRSFAELATKPVVLDPVIEHLNLTVSAQELSGQITATIPTDTAVMEIVVANTDPALSARIANTLAAQMVTTVEELAPVGLEGRKSVVATVVEQATQPTSPASPNLVLYVLVGIGIGILLGIGQALVREAIDNRISSEYDIAKATELPILASINKDRHLANDNPAHGQYRFQPQMEGYRRLWTNLRFLGITDPAHTVLVTSTLAGEGKTTTAIGLAVAASEAGSSVLLIDADFRKPQLARRYSLSNDVGLSTVVLGRTPLSQVLHDMPGSTAKLLASGPVPANPSGLLGSEAMSHLLDELMTTFDTVIIDSPPLLPVADSSVLAAHADGAVVIVGSAMVRQPQLNRALTTLTSAGARTLGLVVNMANERYDYADKYGYSNRAVTEMTATE